MDLTTPAIVCTVRAHGEHGAVVRLLTPAGLLAGYVRGGRSRRLRPVLQAGNSVRARLVARVDSQLAAATVELDRARTVVAMSALGGAALEWLTALTATALTEGEAHPRVYEALDGLLEAMMLGAASVRWLAGLVQYELLLLAELGFGLDLTSCAATGTLEELAYVSPKSAQAVSRQAGEPYKTKLFALPRFLIAIEPVSPLGTVADYDSSFATALPDLLAGFKLTGHFLARDILTGKDAGLLAARARLVEIVAAMPINATVKER